jgi:hypothetical protein
MKLQILTAVKCSWLWSRSVWCLSRASNPSSLSFTSSASFHLTSSQVFFILVLPFFLLGLTLVLHSQNKKQKKFLGHGIPLVRSQTTFPYITYCFYNSSNLFYHEDGGNKFPKPLVPIYHTGRCHIADDCNI